MGNDNPEETGQEPLHALRCTAFPDLLSETDEIKCHRFTQGSQLVKRCRIPLEIAILAWATLLESYTGHEEVIFRVDNDLVKVATSTLTCTKMGIVSGLSEDDKCTGVFTTGVVKFLYHVHTVRC